MAGPERAIGIPSDELATGRLKVIRDRARLAHAKRFSPEADVEEHVRLAIYSVKRGTAEEVGEIARGGMLPILREQPGFVRYGLVLLDDGSLASVSVWETHDEAEAANASTADFVAESLADRVELQNRHTGDFLFDEGA
jgi:heme-degrading monooxygenase HmoA